MESIPPIETEQETEEERTLLRKGEPASPPAKVVAFDVRAQMWKEGRAMLRSLTGQLNGQAGSTIGGFLKAANGDCTVVLDTMKAAVREGPYEPIQWIFKGIQARVRQRSKFEQLHEAIGSTSLWFDDDDSPIIDATADASLLAGPRR